MEYTKKQHYVPQFYLKRFCLIEDKLNIQFKNENKILKNQLVRNIACENDYFDISVDESISPLLEEVLKEIDFENKNVKDYVHTNNMEKFFSELESFMGNIFLEFEEYILNEQNINTVIPFYRFFQTKKYIISYILIQYMRSPMYRDLYKKFYNGLCEICNNYAMKSNWINQNEKNFDISIQSKDDAKVHHIKQIGGLKNYDAMMKCICGMTCDILINRTDEPFITSDSPVCALKKVDNKHYVYSFFKSGECNMIIFPFSKQICMIFKISFLSENDWYIKYSNDINEIKKINTIISKCSKNQIYTSLDQLNILENLDISFIEIEVQIGKELYKIK